MAKKNQSINLLPQKEFEASVFGRVLTWLVTTFRYIVISVEMVVMMAFLSRFYLDAKSGDLTDAINQKVAIISSYSTFENQFRGTQNKLTSFVNFSSNSSKVSTVVDDISAKIPTNITLTEIIVNNSKINITAQAQDENSASNFINSLNSSDLVTNVELSSINQKEGVPGIVFTLTGLLKERGTNGS